MLFIKGERESEQSLEHLTSEDQTLNQQNLSLVPNEVVRKSRE